MWCGFREKWLKLEDIFSRDMTKVAKRHYQEFHEMLDTLTPYTGEVRGRRILDIGCGRLYPYTLLLHNLGNMVTGIDIVFISVIFEFIRTEDFPAVVNNLNFHYS